MASNLKPIRPQDFDADALLKAAKEGRLFIKTLPPNPKKVREENARHILQYVNSIRAYAAEPYSKSIDEIWNEIIQHPDLFKCFIIQRGADAGCMNKYTIMALVDLLRNLDVYTGASSIQLHRILEKITTRNKFYNNMGMYAFGMNSFHIIREIIAKYKEYK